MGDSAESRAELQDSPEQNEPSAGSTFHRSPRWRPLAAWVAVAVAALSTLSGGVYWLYHSRDAGPGIEIVLPTPAPVIAQVSGAVANPGVYELSPNSRVQDLLDAAGGTSSDANLDSLNLARALLDGERVEVPRRDTEIASGGSGFAASEPTAITQPHGLVDLNTATRSELEELPNIGPSRANLIISHRQDSGPIQRVDDLLAISGIGPATVEAIRSLVVQP